MDSNDELITKLGFSRLVGFVDDFREKFNTLVVGFSPIYGERWLPPQSKTAAIAAKGAAAITRVTYGSGQSAFILGEGGKGGEYPFSAIVAMGAGSSLISLT